MAHSPTISRAAFEQPNQMAESIKRKIDVDVALATDGQVTLVTSSLECLPNTKPISRPIIGACNINSALFQRSLALMTADLRTRVHHDEIPLARVTLGLIDVWRSVSSRRVPERLATNSRR